MAANKQVSRVLSYIRRNQKVSVGVGSSIVGGIGAASVYYMYYDESSGSYRRQRLVEEARALEQARHQEAIRAIESKYGTNSGTAVGDDDSSSNKNATSTDTDDLNASSDDFDIPIMKSIKNIFHETKTDDENPNEAQIKNQTRSDDIDMTTDITSMVKSFASLITGEISESEFGDMIHHAQNISQKGDMDETRSTLELINLFLEKQGEVQEHISKASSASVSASDWLLNLDPTSLFYFLEREDEIKNPSWKRRKHRYCNGVDVKVVHGLNDALHLSEISYFGTEQEIREKLLEYSRTGSSSSSKSSVTTVTSQSANPRGEWELVYCQSDALPEQPSHYLAIKKGQSRWSPQLEILLAVRGTNSVPDVLTDALFDHVEYRSIQGSDSEDNGGGNGDRKAHAGILRSGQYLVKKHRELLLSLLKKSKKKRIKLTLVGHSLGAGAAAIAGMEFHNDPAGCFDVNVVGFGCPAILSKNLSEGTKDYITTVIADSDMIPRMSAETIGNVMLDVMEFDWTSMAKRDVKDALLEMRKSALGGLLLPGSDSIESIMMMVDSAVDKHIKPSIQERTNTNMGFGRRLENVLYPPGSCVHFYRDGVSISGSYVPCDFFDEIDVSRTMVDDHLLSQGYRKIFLEVMRSFLSDDHFRFDDII